MNTLRFLFSIFIIFNNSEALKWNKKIATIAVMEYQPVWKKTPESRVEANTERYIDLIRSINETNLDMIIFPESTLDNTVEMAVEVKTNTNPCESPGYAKYVTRLSCATRRANAYSVINLVEKKKCNSGANCHKYYNTDVIFDRKGTIVARYRKYNLFGEKHIDKPPYEEIVVNTDFGLKLGIFTCFDILFKKPTQELLKRNIDGVIFPTFWFSQLPFLTSLQTQQMWAQAHEVMLFSAGANSPKHGNGGSGVYDGALGMVLGGIEATGGSRVHVYKNVGESPHLGEQKNDDLDTLARKMDGFLLSTDKYIQKYNSTVLDTTKRSFARRLCYKNQLCCRFSIVTSTANVTKTKRYVYHLVAYSGTRQFKRSNAVIGIEVCGVIACLNASLSSCGRRFPNYDEIDWPVTFEELTITAEFEKNEDRMQYPNSLLSSIRPISAKQTVWASKEKRVGGRSVVERRFGLRESQSRILTFAIYGRDFGKDSKAATKAATQAATKAANLNSGASNYYGNSKFVVFVSILWFFNK